ncbi:MAG: ABA4-like family protein [Paracoccaceae bacterium]
MIDAAYTGFTTLAFLAWVVLIGFPSWAEVRARVLGRAVPALFAGAYVALLPALAVELAQAPDAFATLDGLAALLTANEAIVLAAWLHYLAFDLLVGRTVLDDGRSLGMPHRWLIAPLVFCFLAGPLGWLLFQGLRILWTRRTPSAAG